VDRTVDADLDQDPEGPSYGYSHADQGTDLFEREQALGLEQDLKVRIEEIDRALKKMDEGTYGVSEQSGKPIPIARLRVVPWARFLVDETGD
jgi:RNA polymerase-binding transcription factor DksA